MPAGSTYTPIATTTLGSAQTAVTFSSISGSYTDLVLIIQAATTHTDSTFLTLTLNSDTGSNYSLTEVYGNGSSATSTRASSLSQGYINSGTALSTTVGNNVTIVNLMNYSNTTTNKTYLVRQNQPAAIDYTGTGALVGLWRNTSAINSVKIENWRAGAARNFATGSTFTLYGIASA